MKIIDFNVAKQSKSTMLTCTGLPEWSAPEMLQRSHYTTKIDMWSLGCVLYFMLFAQKPFGCDNIAKLHKLVLKGKYKIPPPAFTSTEGNTNNI